MPYDPRMLQLTRMGVGMMTPPPSPFERAAPQQPKQWWDQPLPKYGQPADQSKSDDPSTPDDPNAPKKPPSMFDMMMGLGRMSPQQYNQRIHGTPPGQQQVWLGGLGGGRP